MVSIEPATLDDAEGISRLVAFWAERGEMLHRPVSEVYEAVRDFKVARLDGELVGCASLHIMGRDLAEVRSLAVKEDVQAKGIGAALVRACLADASAFGIERVFALTYKPRFFEKLAFRVANVMEFPQKVWNECVRCPFFTNCKEVAVVLDMREGHDLLVPMVRP